MTARGLFAALLAITLAGCGGSNVCFQFQMPDYCKLPPPPAATLTVQNACAYPLPIRGEGNAVEPAAACTRDSECGTAQRCQVSGTKRACVWTLPPPEAGHSLLQPGEAATFRLPRDPQRAVAWSGAVFAQDPAASRAELALRDGGDTYAVHAVPSLPLRLQPEGQDCAPADAEHPGPQACRGANSQYVITFCAAPGAHN